MDLIVPVDVELVLIGWLAEQLDSAGLTATVATVAPNPRPARSVTVFVVGGDRPNLVTDRPLVTVECRAGTEAGAAALANLVDGLVRAADVVGGVQFYTVTGGRPANFPDPAGPRYTATYQIGVRAAVTTIP